MIAAGLTPSNETLEEYLSWLSPESPDNVIQVQVGIR